MKERLVMYENPLFIVTGGSGSGKTSIAIELGKIMSNLMVLDMDFLVDHDDFEKASNMSLMIARFNDLCNKGTVLFGNVPYPYNFTTSEIFPYFNHIHYIYLYCSPEERINRLRKREIWGEEDIANELILAEDMLEEYMNKEDSFILDTTNSDARDIAIQLQQYIDSMLIKK